MAAVGALALPPFAEWRAPAAWHAVDFISDLHLAENTPRTFEAFARHLRSTDADAVFILGDLFEAWVGDDARHAGFEAQCAGAMREAASQRTLAFMAGNRDFLVGADFLEACGVTALPDPTVLIAFGSRLLLSHGDALCLSDTNYQRFRAQVRSTAWQGSFLAQPIAERRAAARAMRDASQAQKSRQGAAQRFDLDVEQMLRWMQAAGTSEFVHGHTHEPGSQTLAAGRVRHVLSDWDLDTPGSPARAEVLRWDGSRLARIAPSVC